jgi:hypothetical protein
VRVGVEVGGSSCVRCEGRPAVPPLPLTLAFLAQESASGSVLPLLLLHERGQMTMR